MKDVLETHPFIHLCINSAFTERKTSTQTNHKSDRAPKEGKGSKKKMGVE
jgi:hypothetical protein